MMGLVVLVGVQRRLGETLLMLMEFLLELVEFQRLDDLVFGEFLFWYCEDELLLILIRFGVVDALKFVQVGIWLLLIRS
jgi:hypothetical protein